MIQSAGHQDGVNSASSPCSFLDQAPQLLERAVVVLQRDARDHEKAGIEVARGEILFGFDGQDLEGGHRECGVFVQRARPHR